CTRKISALRRMVLLSSMTITLTPRSLDKSANFPVPWPVNGTFTIGASYYGSINSTQLRKTPSELPNAESGRREIRIKSVSSYPIPFAPANGANSHELQHHNAPQPAPGTGLCRQRPLVRGRGPGRHPDPGQSGLPPADRRDR